MKRIGFIILFMLAFGICHATHVRSVDLKVQPNCAVSALSYKVTVVIYLDNDRNNDGIIGHTPAGFDAYLNFGHGNELRVNPAWFTVVVRPDLGEQVSVATFEIEHSFPANGSYLVSYREGDRNDNILNIQNSGDVDYITFVDVLVTGNCNNLPILPVPPLDKACHQVTFFHTSGAYDLDGDSLSYEMTTPSQSRTEFATYVSPTTAIFYPNIFNVGNEEDTGQPTLGIDALSGLLTWNAPGRAGEYNVAFKIIEWRKDANTNQYIKLSTTVRDMQIVVLPCTNQKPLLIVPQDVCVVAGDILSETIFGVDADNDSVKIEVFSLATDLSSTGFPATYQPNPGEFQLPRAELQFQWQTNCVHVRNQPYQVVFKITDKPAQGVKLVTFKIWNIKVVAPKPILQNATLDIVKAQGVLQWQSYGCSNASSIQIWRKVGPFDYTPGACAVGVPRSVGYNLIATVPASQTTFTDTNAGLGLSPGAMYCYRLVAYFDAPASTPSIVSVELCIGPVQADAPVITHVSIVQTDIAQGSTQISWRSPFNINTTQFPRDTYEYEIYRADDFFGESNITKVGRTADTTFLHSGINTQEKVFNYRVVLFAKPPLADEKIPVDTSAVASSERLSLTRGEGFLSMAWRDSVPWSNVVQSRPYHIIYRGTDSVDPADMIVYDSVNVAEDGYTYIDDGPLEADVQYAYRILTRGTYGNSDIRLQENFSQITAAYTISNLKPCTPRLVIQTIDCEEYWADNNCNQTVFSNTLRWSVAILRGCRKNINRYNIYAAQEPSGLFTLVGSTTDTVYVDANLPSFARCYKVSAVDIFGEESIASDSICNDNCPYFMLPNVFTPGVVDGANDTFNANFDQAAESSPDGIIIRCPRFVEEVVFQVYNRWGKAVYSSSTVTGGSSAIEWNGVDDNGNAVGGGVYYYTAVVQFNTLDPTKQKKEYRGWIKLVR